jgi:uncharacterized protein YjiK
MPALPVTPVEQVHSTVARTETRAVLPFGPEAKVKPLAVSGGKSVKEPSGIVYHPGRGTLFVVGDRGGVAEISMTGEVVRRVKLDDHGFEGVTVGPHGRLFAIEEKKKPVLYELHLDTLQVVAQYEVDTKIHGERVLGDRRNKSAEGVTYVPGENAFYCVNQDPPRLVKLEVPLDQKDGKARAVKGVDLSAVIAHQASDVTYDEASGHFLVLESSGGWGPGALYELTREGQLVRRVAVPGVRAEGLALDGAGAAFISDDAGGVLRIDP